MPIERHLFHVRDRFRRGGFGFNPLAPRTFYEEPLPEAAPGEPTAAEPPTPMPRKPRSPKAATPPAVLSDVKPQDAKRVRYTTNLPYDLIEQARNAAWASRTPLNSIAEEGLRRELARLEKENGGTFPQRRGELTAGRRLS